MAYPEQPSYVRIGSSWKTIEGSFVYISGEWKRVNQAFIYHSGAWKRFYAYDTIAPTVSEFVLTDTTSGQTYGSTKTTASYRLTFSEPVEEITSSDISFESNPGGVWSVSSFTNVNSENQQYLIEISASSTPVSGNIQLSVASDGLLDDSTFNAVSGDATSQIFSIDTTVPSVSEFSSSSSATSSSVVFTLRFSEPVTGLTTSDLSISASSTSTGWSISSLTGSGQNYSVTVTESGSAINGTLILTLGSNSVTDLLGNVGPASNTNSSTFTVARVPAAPSITATSVNTTLHNRRIDYTVSVPAGLTTISHVEVYLYDSADNPTGASDTIDVTDTTSAFTTSDNFDVGRNPGTKYYLRARTKNTLNLYSDFSSRFEITTGADQTPPVLAAPTLTANAAPADPGYPGQAVTRSISYSFASPSSYLTNEVASVTIYCYRVSNNTLVTSSTVNKPGGGWGSSAITGTFSSLLSGTEYRVYAMSTDIYGGANSTANSSATNATTVATQTGYQTYTNSYTIIPGLISGVTPFADSSATLNTFNYPFYASDGATSTIHITRGDSSTHWWSADVSGYDWPSLASGTEVTDVQLTAWSITTGRSQNLGLQFKKGDGNWISGTGGTDPIFGNYWVDYITGTGANTAANRDITDVSVSTSSTWTVRIVSYGVSYSGYTGQGVTTSLGTSLRTGIVELSLNFSVYSRTPYYY